MKQFKAIFYKNGILNFKIRVEAMDYHEACYRIRDMIIKDKINKTYDDYEVLESIGPNTYWY